MKKILVPIDYSACANNAVHYAVALSKKLNASIHLVHGLAIPEFNDMSGIMIWPAENFMELSTAADEQLKLYVEKLMADVAVQSPSPTITYSIETGSVKQVIDQLVASSQFDLIVMGLAGASALDRFFIGSNSREVIAQTKVPVLLIPQTTTHLSIDKIAFATDLTDTDIHVIHSIARLFCLFNPEILLAHVDDHPADFHDPSTPANRFLNMVTCNLNYSKIYYRHVKAKTIDAGLKWLSENAQLSMLAMIHRHPNIFSRILAGSHTQRLAKSIRVPLLVMPEDQVQSS